MIVVADWQHSCAVIVLDHRRFAQEPIASFRSRSR